MSEPLVNDPAPSPAMELLRENALAAALAVLLLLNLAGLFQYIFGLDTAIVITLLAGYKTFYNSISALLEKRVSADLALCVAVIAALVGGRVPGRRRGHVHRHGRRDPGVLRRRPHGSRHPPLRRAIAAGGTAVGQRPRGGSGRCHPGAGRPHRRARRGAHSRRWRHRAGCFFDRRKLHHRRAAAGDKEPGTKSSPARSTATDCCASASPAPAPRPPWRAWSHWWRRLNSSAHPWSAWPTATPTTFCRPCCWPARSLSISPATGCARSRC